MTKKLIKNSMLYTIGDFINVAIGGFLLLPFYTRYLEQSEYGLFNVLNASVTILTFIVHFGLISTYSRLYFDQKNEKEKRIFAGQIIIIHFIMSFLIMSILFVFEKDLQYMFLKSINNTLYIYYIFVISIMSFITSLYSMYLRVNEEAGKFIFFQASQVTLYISFIFILQIWVEGILDAILLASFLSSFLAWLFSIFNLKITFSLKKITSAFKKISHFSLPVFIGYMMYFILNKFNILFLQYYESMENIALFSFAFQLSMVLTIFAGSIGKAVQPIIFKLSKDELIKKTKKIAFLYKIVLSVILIVFYGLSEQVILLFAPVSYANSNEAFLLLLLGIYIYNFRAVESHLFMYFNKPRYGLYIITLSAIFVVLLSFILVEKYGYIGSAYAILIGSSIAYLASKLFTYRLLNSEYK